MNKYLKLYESHSQYVNPEIKPNVSYCRLENEVHYNPHTFADEYFTTVARENGTISFNILKSMGTDKITSISYSTDNGKTWETTNNTDNKEENLVITVNVNNGDKVIWKGNATQLGYYDEDGDGDVAGSFFSSDCEFDVKGNVMSLLYENNFKDITTLEETGVFCNLFSDYEREKTCGIVNAKDLSLPATTLIEFCYYNMFSNCTSLTTAPELPATTLVACCYEDMFWGCTSLTSVPSVLPATTLANYCYSHMFYNCTSLTTAPEISATTLANSCCNSMFDNCTSLVTVPSVLPATTLAEHCYNEMFRGCTSLTTAPKLPATTLADNCYSWMFFGCRNLTTAPELPATTLASNCYASMFSYCRSLATAPALPATTLIDHCYNAMFNNCTSLTTAPELPATTLASSCYSSMFAWCASLTNAPELPVTSLAENCYSKMFVGCTSLITAPELPATTLVDYCYYLMFSGCTKLNYIKAMFTTTPTGLSPNRYTTDWVKNVASSGTFVKNSAASWNVTGTDGVPRGWTVQTAAA